jgi:hypothetical protein
MKRRVWRALHKPDKSDAPCVLRRDADYDFTRVLVFAGETRGLAVDHLDSCFGEDGWDRSSLKMIGWTEED